MPSKTRAFRKESKKMSVVILPRLHSCLLSFFILSSLSHTLPFSSSFLAPFFLLLCLTSAVAFTEFHIKPSLTHLSLLLKLGIQDGGSILTVTLATSIQAPSALWATLYLHKNTIFKCGCSLPFMSLTVFIEANYLEEYLSDLHNILHSHSSEGKNPPKAF